MNDVAVISWDNSSEVGIVKMVRKGPSDKVRVLAREFDWDRHSDTVLSSLMARKDIDLGTALSVFFNAGPLQYNYLSKRDVPHEFHAMCRVLDTICQRINCGYYLPESESCVVRKDKLQAWIKYQQDDKSQGRAGRWILNEKVVEKMAAKGEPKTIAAPQEAVVIGFRLLREMGTSMKNLGDYIPFAHRIG